MANENNTRNLLIKDVEFWWVKLDKAVAPFGVDQYEIQIRFPKKRKDEFEGLGKMNEQENNMLAISLKKKAFKADGTEAKKVEVVDIHKNPMSAKSIGNGSKGNIILMLRDYQIKAPNGKVTKEGTTAMPTKVQITELIKYESKESVDFDDYDGATVTTSDDDIDF
jgi:hypothetical protein